MNKKLTEEERQRYQAILDAQWEAKLEWKEFNRKLAERKSFNRGPGDPDWEFVKDD